MWKFFFFFILLFFFPTAVSAHTEVKVIEMTKEGFEPPSVTVDENATIIFLNRDGNPRWPASNTHPTHTQYPEFDPKDSIQPKDSWSFKPTKPGTWKYHDHLFPHMRGVIIVESEQNHTVETAEKNSLFTNIKVAIAAFLNKIQQFFTPKKKIITSSEKEFVGLPADKQMEVLQQLADNSENPWDYLKKVYQSEHGSSGSVHDLAHFSGSLLYTSHGLKGIAICSQDFAFGCYHGLLDEAFAKDLTHLLDAEKACLELGADRNATGPASGCIHGIGHGVASFYGTKDLTASLQTCTKLAKGSDYCFDGVFMEFVRSAPDSFFHQNDPLYPCSQFEEESYLAACGRNQPSLLFGRFHMSFEETAAICGSSQSQGFKQNCFNALGFSLAISEDVDHIVSSCQSITDPAFEKSCMEAAAGELVFQQIPNWSEKSQAVCEALPSDSQPQCFEYVQNVAQEFGFEL